MGYQPLLDAVDDGKLGVTLLGFFEQASRLVEEPYILHGNSGLVGEGLNQLDLFVRQQLGFGAAYGDDAYGLSLAHERHSARQMVAVLLGHLVSFRVLALYPRLVKDRLYRPALDHRPAGHRVPIEMNAFANRDHGNIAMVGLDAQHVAVLDGDDGVVRSRKPGCVSGDDIQHRLDVGGRLGNDSQDVVADSFPLERLRDLSVLSMNLVKQTRVLKSHAHAVGQGG